MKYFRQYLFLLPFLSLTMLSGQNFDRYERLKASGPLPEDFILSTEEKYQYEMQGLDWQENMSAREMKAAFFQKSAYYLNQLLQSGKVLFNDELSQHIQQIADYLLRSRPELREQLRFYVVKSPSANAFASNDGIILINMGLLARLENEAQLAFILSHEISHYIKQHPLDIFMQSNQPRQNARMFGAEAIEQALVARNNYSREKEEEADRLGLNLYLQSNYDLESVLRVFEILKFAHLPFADEAFSAKMWETEHLKIPSTYFLEKVTPVHDLYKNYDESLSSHPSPDTRKAIMQEVLKGRDNRGRSSFLYGKEKFMRLREIARFETCYLQLQNHSYESAIYHSFVLLKEHPNSFYLQKVIAQALYGLSRYADEGKFWDVHIDFDEVEGQQQQLYHVMEKLEDEELNLMTLVYCWNLYNSNAKDQELKLMVEDLMLSMGKNYIPNTSFFSHEPADLILPSKGSMGKYAIPDLMNDPAFMQLLRKKLIQAANPEKQESPVYGQSEQRSMSSKGIDLGLEKVVFVDPTYKRLDHRTSPSIQYLESENAQGKLQEDLQKYANQLGLDHVMLSSSNLKSDKGELFNDLVQLREWMNEKTDIDKVKKVALGHEEMQRLKEKYGTQYFVWTEVVSTASPKKNKLLTIISGVIVLPYALYSALSPRYDTYIYTMVYDIESGNYVVIYPKYLNLKDREDFMQSTIYDLVWQMKK
jgi:Zn-dependent protease with chaperone function